MTVEEVVLPDEPAAVGEVIEVIAKAGIVTFSPFGNVLLTTTSNDANKWVLCKGHLEDQDKGNLLQCALREAREELGVVVEPYFPNPIGTILRMLDAKTAEEITFFVGEVAAYVSDGERAVMTLKPIDALRRLYYDDYAEILLKALTEVAAFNATKVVYLKNQPRTLPPTSTTVN